jgi:CheY-like chemotaxis protein
VPAAESGQKREPACSAERMQDESILKGKRVLLCEDNQLNREIATTLLEAKAMIVHAVENGRLGVSAFQESPVGFYDVILMDIRMPVLDGYEATREIRNLDRPDAQTILVIAVTADAFADDVDKCLDTGMDGYIAKPIDPLNMYRVICQLLTRGKQ